MKYEMEKRTAVIVVTYNRCQILLECIRALLSCDGKKDILLIDNASMDGTQEQIKNYQKRKDFYYYNTGKNLGGAGGFYYGIKKAMEKEYDYFWLMDDDTIVEKTALTELLHADAVLRGKYGYLSSVAMWTDGSCCRMNHHELTKDWEAQKQYLSEGMIKINKATFVSFFVKRDVVENVGFPIQEYRIWGEDTEYSLRIAKHYPCYLVGRSKVLHKMKKNESANILRETEPERIERIYYSIRNDVCTYRRMDRKEFFRLTLQSVYYLIRLLFEKRSYRLKRIRILLKGYFSGLFFFPFIEVI